MAQYQDQLKAMTDDELSAEWVRVMTVGIDADTREAQLAAIDEVAHEVNIRYEQAGFGALVMTPKDAKAVADHLKRLIATDEAGWFGEDEDTEVP
jgi:hypothetical protein